MKILKRISNSTPRSIFRKPSVSSAKLGGNPKLRISLDDPTLCSEDMSDRGSSFAGRRVSNRHIRLCEAKNQVYQYDPDEGVSTPSDIWYNKDQLEQFRQDAQDQGRVTETQERGSHDPSWSLALFQTYQSFCRVESAHDMDRIYSALSKLEAIDPHLVGLELHAIPQLSHARGQRRSQLMAQINRVQSCTDMSKSERTRRIRKLSHEASRPSRLFALHLAARVQV